MTLLRLFVAGLLLAPLVSQPVAAQALDPTFTPPASLYAPGQVYAMGPQQADGSRLIAGVMTRVNGTAVTQLVRLNAAGNLDQVFQQNLGTASNIYSVKALPSGQYLLGAKGGGITAAGLSRSELLRLNANGTADASFDPGGGPATSGGNYGYGADYAVQTDGKILVVGYFDSFNNVAAPGVVRLNANGSVDTGFSVGTGVDINSSNVNAVAVQPDGKIVVGGSFETFNGRPASGVVRLNANGSVDATFASPLQQYPDVEGLVVQPDGKILANGYFTVNAGNANPGLVRLLSSGSLDTGFSTTAFSSGGVSTSYLDPAVVLQPDGKILTVGYFTTANGSRGLARLNANGTLDLTFQVTGGPTSYPTTVGLQANGTVLVGTNSAASLFNGTSENPLARFSSSGAFDAAFAPTLQVAGAVLALVRQTDGKLVLGGNFTEINGQAVHRLARLSSTGALDTGFSTAVGVVAGPVNCLALQPDGKLLAGTTQNVYRYTSSGSPDPGFVPFTALATTALAVQPDGRIMVAGGFGGSGGGVAYNRLLRLTSTGAFDPSFARVVTNAPTGNINYLDAVLVQPDSRIVIGGVFRNSTTGVLVGRVVRYEATGALDATFNNASTFTTTLGTATIQNRIYALALQPDGKLLAAGNFGAVDGMLHYGVARLSATGVPDSGFSPDALLTGNVFCLALQPNGRVLLGGNFANSGATSTHSNLARVLDTGLTDTSFGISATPNATVRALLVQPDGAIVLAGGFTNMGGQRSVGVARISAPNVLHVAAPAAVAARTAAWPVPAHGLLHIAPDLSAHPLAVELLDALGRQVRYQAATTAPEQTLNIESLPAGVYVLRVSYTAGAVTRRLAVQ